MIDRSIALPWVWLNGKLTPASRASISVFDRSFTLGDGVFDTLRILNSCPLQWRAHWRRFSRTAKQLGFSLPARESDCLEALQKVLRKNKVRDVIARIHLSRGISPRGYSIARSGEPTLVISLHSMPEITPGKPAQWKLGVADILFPNSRILTEHKTASRAFHIAVKMETDRAGFDDALVLNERGEVVEAISSNIFWMSGDTIFTPPLNLGVLPGTTRDRVLKLCRSRKIKCEERAIPLKKLLKADAVFLSVSTSGIIEVVQIGKTKLKRHPIIAELHKRLETFYQREAGRWGD